MQFQTCPHCQVLTYCSQYCREVHWTLNHHLSCRSARSNVKRDESMALGSTDRYSGRTLPVDQESSSVSMSHNSAFETLPVQMSQPVLEATAEITNDLCHPSSSSSSSTAKKKSFKTLLSLLRVGSKRRWKISILIVLLVISLHDCVCSSGFMSIRTLWPLGNRDSLV